jgi:hypothetical protein
MTCKEICDQIQADSSHQYVTDAEGNKIKDIQ